MRRWILIFSICLLQGCVDGDTDHMVEGVKASEEVPDGLSQSDWAGIRKAYTASRHRVGQSPRLPGPTKKIRRPPNTKPSMR